MRPAGLEIDGVKMPVLAARIAHATTHGGAVNAQRWSNRQRRVERGLNQQTCVARGRQEVLDRTAIPGAPRRCRGRGLRKQIGRGGERQRGGGSPSEKVAAGRHGETLNTEDIRRRYKLAEVGVS